MTDFFWFSDEQWARIAPLLPTDVRGMKRVDDHRVLSGIVHALKCGGRWVDCADVYGPKKTLYNRFVRWFVGRINVRSIIVCARTRQAGFGPFFDFPLSASDIVATDGGFWWLHEPAAR